MRGEASYPWRRTGHGACMSLPGGAPGESGKSFSPAGAPGTPWSVETGRGMGGGGQTRTTGGMEGAVKRKRLEGGGDLKDGGREKKIKEERRGRWAVRQNRWQWLTVKQAPLLRCYQTFILPAYWNFCCERLTMFWIFVTENVLCV